MGIPVCTFILGPMEMGCIMNDSFNFELFDEAMDFVFRWEGGLCEDKNDAGGITNYGICLRFLKSVDPKATREDIKNMTKDKAKDLFYQNFWLPCRCDELSDKVAFVLFDTAINVGVSQASKFLQRVVGVKDDGKVGPDTVNAVKEYIENHDEATLVSEFLKKRSQFYKNIVANRPSQKVFLKGWLNRTTALAEATVGTGETKLA